MINRKSSFKELLLISALTSLVVACSSETNNSNASISLPNASSPGAQLLKQKCSSCHGVPQPSSRTANLWPSIIIRMLGHRRTQGFSPMTEDEIKTLTDYLQTYAGDKK